MEDTLQSHSDDVKIDDIRADLAAAAERRAQELQGSPVDGEKQHAQERAIRQGFRRMLDPGILRPNSVETAMASVKVCFIAQNLLARSYVTPCRRYTRYLLIFYASQKIRNMVNSNQQTR